MNRRTHSLFYRFSAWVKQAFALLFQSNRSALSLWIESLWLAGLYLGGGVIWSFFLNWGRLGFDLHDWTQEGPRYAFLRQALLENRFPLHIGTSLVSTERFLAIPDTIISPQILLLRFIEPGTFVWVNTLFLYSLGFLGLLLLRRKFNWSPITCTVVFALFSLNGHPMVHVAVGHSMWISYFLLPYFAYLVFNLLDGQNGWKWVTQMALLQFAFYLQGGFHFVNWSLMFLVLLGIFSIRHLEPILKALLFSVLLSMPRILPAAIEFNGLKRGFISGYFSITDLFNAFTALKAPEEVRSWYSALGWWEVDAYIGLLGFVFLVVFGVWMTWKAADAGELAYGSILMPSLVMVVLSIGKIYQPITLIPLPLVSVERVSSRFVILPVVMLLFLGGVQLERFLRSRTWDFQVHLAGLMLVGVMGHDLLQHARLWRVENMNLLFDRTPVEISADVLIRSDPTYFTALLVGLGVAALTLIFLVYKIHRQRPSLLHS